MWTISSGERFHFAARKLANRLGDMFPRPTREIGIGGQGFQLAGLFDGVFREAARFDLLEQLDALLRALDAGALFRGGSNRRRRSSASSISSLSARRR